MVKFQIRIEICLFSLFLVGVPQQRKLMGSSAQNSSGVHWCRHRVRFNRVPEKVPEKVCQQGSREGSGQGLGGFGAEPGQGQQGSVQSQPSQVQRVPGNVAEGKPGQVHLAHGNLAEVFPALGFAARFRKVCKNKTLRLLGIPPKLIFHSHLVLPMPFFHLDT